MSNLQSSAGARTKALEAKQAPRQARGAKTVESILTATAELLDEVGFERLSTNMICKKAGLAPPSLYRFFPNKYAILKTLGERLMAAQNSALTETAIDSDALEASFVALLRRQFAVTQAFAGGGRVMRSLHAVPMLNQVRMASHAAATKTTLQGFPGRPAGITQAALAQRTRLLIEMGYAALEHAFDVSETESDAVLRHAGRTLALDYRDVFGGQL